VPVASTRVSADCEQLEGLLEGIIGLSLAQLRQRARKGKPPPPPLYASGVRYRRERRGQEDWQSIAETYKRKAGDCEDLVAARVAELRYAGEKGAMPKLYSPRPGLVHCIVLRADGTTEDPSKVLGMKGKG
jgi:hypothetical protein